MSNPILLVVDDQAQDLERIRRELSRRYTADYEIVTQSSLSAALRRLETLRDGGEQMAEVSGSDCLDRAHDLFPYAWRVLLIPWSNRSATRPILRSITQGKVDRYIAKSARTPDEQFHRVITELLQDWIAAVCRSSFWTAKATKDAPCSNG